MTGDSRTAWVSPSYPDGSEEDEPPLGFYSCHYETDAEYVVGPAGDLPLALGWARSMADRVIVDLNEVDGLQGRYSAGRTHLPGLPQLDDGE